MNFNFSKRTKLAYSILFDACGYLSFIIPFFDVLWAPASAYLMTRMYEGKTGKIAGVISFIEEALPGFDVIPTFTLMWIYTYIIQGKKEEVIEIDS